MKSELLLWLGLGFFNTSHLQKLGFLYAISLFLALKMHHHMVSGPQLNIKSYYMYICGLWS